RRQLPGGNRRKRGMLVNAIAEIGARGRGRTGTPFRTRDFKSLASTNFATRAGLLGMWRRGSESNRRIRSCSPLHNHSATAPENLPDETKNLGRTEVWGIWSGKRGSNSRPQPWQGCALPTELFPHFGDAQVLRQRSGI